MNATPNPPRLVDDPVLGSAFRTLDGDGLSPDRLAKSARALEAALAAPAAGAPLFARPLVRWGLALLTATLAALAVNRMLPRSTEPVVAPAVPAPALPAPTVPVLPDRVEAAPAAKPRVVREERAPVAAPTPGSTLAEQLRLFDEARSSAKANDFAAALATLDRLVREHPETVLEAEVAVSRADYLARAGRNDEAIAALERLAADPRHAGRRVEVLRALGDLLVREGECARAVPAYRAALEAAAGSPAAAAIEEGLARCSRP